MPSGCEQAEVDLDDVPRFARRVDAVAARIVHVGVEQPRQRLAR